MAAKNGSGPKVLSKGRVGQTIEQCIRDGVPVEGGKILITVPEKYVLAGMSRHIRVYPHSASREVRDHCRRVLG